MGPPDWTGSKASHLVYSVVGGALGAGPGPSRELPWRPRSRKNANPAMINKPATAPSVPPIMAPVRLPVLPSDDVGGASVGTPLDDELSVGELVDAVVLELVVVLSVELLLVVALFVVEPMVVGSESELGDSVKPTELFGRSKLLVMPSTDV